VDGRTVTTEVVAGSGSQPAQVSVTVGPAASGAPQPATVPVLGATIDGASLNAVLPSGIGLSVVGPQGAMSAGSAMAALASAQAGLSPTDEDRAALVDAASRYVAGLPSGTMMVVRAVTPVIPTGAQASSPIVINGGGGSVREVLLIDARSLPAGSTLQLNGVDFAMVVGNAQVTMAGGNGYLIGDGQNQTIVAGTGNDTMTGGMGADELNGMEGADFLEGNMAADVLSGFDGADTINGGKGHDRLFGGLQADLIRGGLGNDSLSGGKGHDVLDGGGGDDTLIGGMGNDTLTAGDGTDLIVFGAGDGGQDMVMDFGTGDRIEIVAGGAITAGMSVEDLLATHLTTASNGNAVLRFGAEGPSLTLTGVSAQSLLDDPTRITIVTG